MPNIRYWIIRFLLLRRPHWLFYDIGENGWYPTIGEQIVRGIWNVLFFLLTIEIMFYISIVGLQTPFFDAIKEVAKLLGKNELTWLVYGLILGIGGSLVFGSITNFDKSVLSRFRTSLVYILYFTVFIFALNLFFIFFTITF